MFVRYYFDVCLVKLIHILRSQIHTNYTRDIHDVLEEVGAGFWIGATNIDRLLLYLFAFDFKILKKSLALHQLLVPFVNFVSIEEEKNIL